MKNLLLFLFLFSSSFLFSQGADAIQGKFCNALYKVFELGRQDNFDSYDGTFVKESPFLQVPAYGIKLEKFAINYADKDHRFVAKTNLNLDSLSAVQTLEEMKTFVGNCLDTVNWVKWTEVNGDDAGTVFLKEQKEAKAFSKDLVLTLAITSVAPKIYSLNLYVKRK